MKGRRCVSHSIVVSFCMLFGIIAGFGRQATPSSDADAQRTGTHNSSFFNFLMDVDEQRSVESAFGDCTRKGLLDVGGNAGSASAFSAFTTGTQAGTISICGDAEGGSVSETLTSETLVELAGGSLTITDDNGGNTNDTITLSCAAGNLIVNDPNNTVGAGTGTTQIDANTVSVPVSSVTGNITVSTLAGSDTLTVNLTGCDIVPPGGVFYNGGLPTTAPGDRLNMVGGNQGIVTYNYINASDGSVVMSNFGTINYTGLEPISNTGTSSDAIFNLPAGPTDPAILSDLGGGMSRLSGATFEDTDFMNPTGSVSINRGNAADVLVVNALASGYPTLNIGTDLLPLRGLVFTGPITLAANRNLSAFTSEAIILNTPTSDIVASGTGTISMTTARNLALTTGSSLQVENGNLTLNANQQAVPTPGYFYGVDIFNALVQTVGAGNILINGKGGSDTLSAPTTIITIGVSVRGLDSAVRSNSALPGAGSITINGIGGNAGASNSNGVLISQGIVTSINGNIGIGGVGGTTAGNTPTENTFSVGVNIAATVSTTGTGALSINGTTGPVGPNPASSRGIQLAGSISTFSGDLLISGQSGNAAGVSSFGITSTASITSTTGRIDMTGIGGNAAGNAGFVTSAGINFAAAGSMSCGNGPGCTFIATAGNGGIGASQGYRQDSPMTSTGSNVTITGTGGTAETANFGVSIRNNITATGNANVSITGTGGNGLSGSNHAVQIRGGAVVSTTNGTITAEAIPGTGPDNVAFNLAPTGTGNGTLSATGGNDVNIIADSMFFGPATSAINAANSVVTLRQRTNGVAIDLGAATDPAAGPLGLNDAEIDRITAEHLRIGNANSGPISFSGLVPIVVSDTPFVPTLTLTTGGAINSNPSPGVQDVVAEVLNLSALTTIAVEMNAATVNTISGGPQNLRELDSVLVGSNAINTSGNILTLSGGRFNTNTGGGNIIASEVIAQSGATIGGIGSVVTSGSGIDAQTGSAISPGLSPGILSTNSVAFAVGSIFDVEINGTTVGTGYDRLDVAGTVDVTNATLSVTGAHVPSAGETFLIIDNDGADAVVGTFNGLPEGGTITGFLGSGLDATISYVGGTGNDVVLTVLAAPPATEMQFAAAAFVDDESQSAVITVTRTGDLSGTSSVDVVITDSTATGGASCTSSIDYVYAGPINVSFGIGVSTQSFSVPLCSDTLFENTETATLSFTNNAGADIGTPATATLMINDTANQWRNTAPINIVLGNIASPYPSNITVTGAPTSVGSIRVTLYDLYHDLPDNIDILLVGPNGNKYVLMADVGGPLPIPSSNHVTLTFSDTAAQVIDDSVAPTTGNYKPTNCETPVLSFIPPAPAAPYTEPGCSLIRPVEKSMFGQFGLADGNGTWSLYIRDDAGTPFAPDTLMGEILGGWGLQLLPPTAAGVEVSGRVMTPDGRGLRNATVTMIDGQGGTRTAVTSSFGYYKFEGVTAGDNYLINVNSRLYRFTPRAVFVTDTLTDVDFVGLE